jgi:hypothetical protein
MSWRPAWRGRGLLGGRVSPAGAPLWRVRRRGVFERMEPADRAPAHPTNRCRRRPAEIPKGERDHSRSGKGPKPDSRKRWRRTRARCAWRRLDCQKPSFQWCNGRTVAKADDTPLRAGRGHGSGALVIGLRSTTPVRGSRKRTGRLNAPQLPARVTAGSPGAGSARPGPVWRQSRHSSQTLGVMPETATCSGGRTTDRIRFRRLGRNRSRSGEGRQFTTPRLWIERFC